jgi:uncharacterized iron-regulated protein
MCTKKTKNQNPSAQLQEIVITNLINSIAALVSNKLKAKVELTQVENQAVCFSKWIYNAVLHLWVSL